MCGIAGFFGNNNGSQLSKLGLHFLMVSQDTRGGDSMGLAYSVEHADHRYVVKWGHPKSTKGDTSKVEDFLDKVGNDLSDIRAPYNVIAHARKASAGIEKNIDGAHPFVHDGIILVHNGTVRNWKELAKHFNVDVSDVEVDSEGMLRIIAAGHLDVLKYYEGGAVFVWIDTRTDEVFVWSGASKPYTAYSYGVANKIETERPIHYINTVAGMYISSEWVPLAQLRILAQDDYYFYDEPYKFRDNHLTKIVNGEIVEEIEYKRETLKKGFGEESLVKNTSKTSVYGPEDKIVYSTSPTTSTTSIPDEVYVSKGLYCLNGNLLNTITPMTDFRPGQRYVFHGILLAEGKENDFIDYILDNNTVISADIFKKGFTSQPVPYGYISLLRSVLTTDPNGIVTSDIVFKDIEESVYLECIKSYGYSFCMDNTMSTVEYELVKGHTENFKHGKLQNGI